MKKLVIIAGAAGEIGSSYAKALAEKEIDVIAVIRNKKLSFQSSFVKEIICHLEDEKSIEGAFSLVDLSKYQEVIYLHTIGVDKFDPRGYPDVRPMKTIDEDVYNTNVNSFKYLMRYLVKNIGDNNQKNKKPTTLKIAMIGGVADKYAPFVIESFCEVKNIIRQYIQSQTALHPEWISGLSINVTSTITSSALSVRPFADTTCWLTPQEVVDKSLDALIAEKPGYEEVDIIKKLPNFTSGYYEDKHMLYEKWSKETGIK
jgi:NAD(P)-dependent dehydrogenase (short-subunit alcohol dehydrogenase family)